MVYTKKTRRTAEISNKALPNEINHIRHKRFILLLYKSIFINNIDIIMSIDKSTLLANLQGGKIGHSRRNECL